MLPSSLTADERVALMLRRFAGERRPVNIVSADPAAISDFIISSHFYQAVQTLTLPISSDLLSAIISNLVPFGKTGLNIAHELLDRFCDSPQLSVFDTVFDALAQQHANGLLSPASCELLHKFGLTALPPSNTVPCINIVATKRQHELSLRGFTYDCRGKLQFNPNVLVRYVLTRMKLVMRQRGDYFAYDQAGYFIKLSPDALKATVKSIIAEADPDIWRSYHAREYMETLKVSVQNVEALNERREFINLENGMLNLATFEQMPHDPSFLSTIRIPIFYDPKAQCPRFLEFLHDVLSGDKQLFDLLQELLGYWLTALTIIQKAVCFAGPGSNGKTLLSNLVCHLCGAENVANVPLSLMTGRFGLHNLPEKILNISAENEFHEQCIDSQTFKVLTGSDKVTIERKYRDQFSCRLFCKLLLLCNSLPNTNDHSVGYYRRFIIIPFQKIFIDSKEAQSMSPNLPVADLELETKLLAEMEGILVFALNGLRRLQQNNFRLTGSTAADQALEDYRKSQNPILDFFSTMIQVCPETANTSTQRAEIFKAFKDWCQNNAYDSWNSTQKFWDVLSKVMAEKGIKYDTKKVQGTIHVKNIRLIGQYDQQIVPPKSTTLLLAK